MLNTLSRTDRMKLMRFLCSMAWADLEVQREERSFVSRLVKKLDLDEEERRQVEDWLKVPPRPEEVDPTEIPAEHRKLFLETIRQLVFADRHVDPEERESVELLEQLLGG